MHVGGYAGFAELYRTGRIREAPCMAHVRRKFVDLARNRDAPVAREAVERIALGRKNRFFVGSEAGGATAATAYTLIETAKRNSVDPRAWIADTLNRIQDYETNRIHELMP